MLFRGFPLVKLALGGNWFNEAKYRKRKVAVLQYLQPLLLCGRFVGIFLTFGSKAYDFIKQLKIEAKQVTR